VGFGIQHALWNVHLLDSTLRSMPILPFVPSTIARYCMPACRLRGHGACPVPFSWGHCLRDPECGRLVRVVLEALCLKNDLVVELAVAVLRVDRQITAQQANSVSEFDVASVLPYLTIDAVPAIAEFPRLDDVVISVLTVRITLPFPGHDQLTTVRVCLRIPPAETEAAVRN
jgi:hypothetical protein